MHIKTIFVAACVWACVFAAAAVQASPISLATPLTGNSSAPFVDLTVSFDPNGNVATNITGWEFYVAFAGLIPIDSSFALGSIFQPFAADVIELHGTCGSGGPCSNPPADPSSLQQWVSLASVFAPHLPSGPGTLFTLRFAADPSAPVWSLDLFGESAGPSDPCGVSSALLWEHPTDGTCAISPFAIVSGGAMAANGTAIVGVSGSDASLTAVPEPASLLLVSAGLAVVAARRRRRI